MDKAIAGERVLRLCVSRERAAELVGDLLEARPGLVRFWATVGWLLIAFTWRVGLATLLGSATGIALITPFAVAFSRVAEAHHLPIEANPSPFQYLLGFSMLFWSLAVHSLIRLGPGYLPGLSAAAGMLSGASAALYKLQHAPVWLCIVAAIFAGTACLGRPSRRALKALVQVTASTWIFVFGLLSTESLLIQHTHTRLARGPWFNLIQVATSFLLLSVAQALAVSYFHKEKRQEGSVA